MRRQPLILTLGLAALILGARPSTLAADDALAPLSPEAMQQQLDALANRLGEIQGRLDDDQPLIDDQVASIRKNKYGGSSDPAISGSYGALFKDVEGFGVSDKNGVALVLKFDMSVIETLPDNSVINFNFGPAWTPGAILPPWNVDDTDEEHVGFGTATRLGTLMSLFKITAKKNTFAVTGGFQTLYMSPFTVAGPLSDLPSLFDGNPYRDASTSKSYYENQFLTGVPKRDPTESEHPIMGVRVDDGLTDRLKILAFAGNFQNYYGDSTMAHEYGSMLTLDEKDSIGGIYKAIFYNHSNDAGEIVAADGTLYGYFGLMNNTVTSLTGQQKLGHMSLDFEAANSKYDDSSGVNGVHVDGQAIRLFTETRIGEQILRLGVYYMAPDYLVTDPEGYYQNDGGNLPRYREDPTKPGMIIPETVVADPTIPMNDTLTYHVGTQLREGNAFLNLKLQNSVQTVASDAQIWASHYEGGTNLREGTWFALFNNNYQAWLPPDGYVYGSSVASPVSSANYGNNPYLEREFDYNQLRNGPTPAFPTTQVLNAYNMTYAPSNNPSSPQNMQGITPDQEKGAVFAPGAIYDVNHQYMYNAYHEMETDDLWRSQFEGIVNSSPKTGLADAPSIKNISNFTADMRMNLGDYLPLQNRALYWQTFFEVLTVDNSALSVPSLDPNNLFVQSVVDSTIVYSLADSVNLLLNLGVENWVSNDMAQSFYNNVYVGTNTNGELQNATLEYHEREAGVGMDWNFIPNKLNLYFRAKMLAHEDSFASQNDFLARQLWFQMKSFF